MRSSCPSASRIADSVPRPSRDPVWYYWAAVQLRVVALLLTHWLGADWLGVPASHTRGVEWDSARELLATRSALSTGDALRLTRGPLRSLDWLGITWSHPAMKKSRIVILRFGTARQKLVLERWTNPKPLGTIARSCRYITCAEGFWMCPSFNSHSLPRSARSYYHDSQLLHRCR